jgi:amino acid transporter
MGELAALLPHRTGGMPSYAYESFEPLGKTTAKHIGGSRAGATGSAGSRWPRSTCCWPPATSPCSSTCRWAAPSHRSAAIGAPSPIGVLLITFVGLIGLFIPCYLGIRLGATFATILGVVSMVPLTSWSSCRCSSPAASTGHNISGFHYADPKTAGTVFFLAWIFVISWNAIAMEAAACYIGECRTRPGTPRSP